MATPKLSPDQIAQISNLVADYILAQRDKYAAHALALSAQQRIAIAAFFSPELLGNTRVMVLEGERVANPRFLSHASWDGFPELTRSIRHGRNHVL
jgi:hypothetical protein